jgi:ATP-GRASP peptide maturase of grasp-with-spasm system
MILILSDRNDITTYRVVKWLEQFNKDVLVITDEDRIDRLSIHNNEVVIEVRNKIINFNEIEAYWYRRGDFLLPVDIDEKNLPAKITENIKREKVLLNEILHAQLLRIPNLGNIFNAELNRVCILNKAKEHGLSVPCFGVFNTKSDLLPFFQKHSPIITKPLGNGFFSYEDNKLFINYTSVFTENDLLELPEKFFPSLFMECIKKKYELRIFYLNNECFSMAILSQNDPLTKTDYRRYNMRKPNKNAAYALPTTIKNNLCSLMSSLDLRTGSIDMIVSPEDDFVFLEINPVGQFINVSQACNYNLERQIANYLTGNIK